MRKVFHLYIKGKDKHRYYGSLQALYNHSKELGVSKPTLDRYDFSREYENEKIIIRKGELLTTGDVKIEKETL